MAASKIKGLTIELGGDTTKLGKALEDVNKKGRDLSSELGEINRLLKFDPGNADLLAQKQKVLAEQIANTAKKLDTLKEAERQVQEQFQRGETSEEQVRALQREIVATTKKLDGYENAAKETAEAIEKLGDRSGEVKDGAAEVKTGSDKAADSLDDYADAADKAEEASDRDRIGNRHVCRVESVVTRVIILKIFIFRSLIIENVAVKDIPISSSTQSRN